MSNPLANKIFISTRAKGQNDELRSMLENDGARLVEMPTIEIQPADLSLADREVFIRLENFSWIVFTSPNGIHFFFKILKEINGSYHLPSSIKTAVVGNTTEQILLKYGYETTIRNPGNNGADLANELIKAVNIHDRILFPEGTLARGIISEKLSLIASCTPLVVYQNKMPQTISEEYLNLIINNQYDSIILTSPSGFNNLIMALNNRVKLQQLRLICIGTTTAAAVLAKGIVPLSTAGMSNVNGIVNSILHYYSSKNKI